MRRNNQCYVGHEMTEENTYRRPNNYTVCRQCMRNHWKRYYQKLKNMEPIA